MRYPVSEEQLPTHTVCRIPHTHTHTHSNAPLFFTTACINMPRNSFRSKTHRGSYRGKEANLVYQANLYSYAERLKNTLEVVHQISQRLDVLEYESKRRFIELENEIRVLKSASGSATTSTTVAAASSSGDVAPSDTGVAARLRTTVAAASSSGDVAPSDTGAAASTSGRLRKQNAYPYR